MAAHPRPVPAERSPDAELAHAVVARRRVRLLRIGPRIARAAAAARSGVAFREDTHFHASSRLLPIVRGALLETGERLARAGILDDPAAVWHLRWSELTGIPDPDQVPTPHATCCAGDGGRTVGPAGGVRGGAVDPPGHPAPAHRDRGGRPGHGAGGEPWTGHRGGAGGRGPEDFGRLQPGEALVCPFTNPAWTPLFQVGGGGRGRPGQRRLARRDHRPGVRHPRGDGHRHTGPSVLVDAQRVEVDGTAGVVRAARTGPPAV